MKVVQIPVTEIESSGRLRPVNLAAVDGLARSIRRDGLRQPIEVVKLDKMRWRLVAGAHRLAAFRQLELALIEAVEVEGNEDDLRRLEVMDNLARNELTKLERCCFVAELKRIYQRANPDAKRGGDRKSQGIPGENQSANVGTLIDWYGDVALRSDRAVRSIKREASIGERLTDDSIGRLRGTGFEDNQRELELLSKESPARQAKVVDLLRRSLNPAASVVAALDILDGVADRKAEADEKVLSRLVEKWNRAAAPVRRSFIKTIDDTELAEAMVERGYVVLRDGEAI